MISDESRSSESLPTRLFVKQCLLSQFRFDSKGVILIWEENGFPATQKENKISYGFLCCQDFRFPIAHCIKSQVHHLDSKPEWPWKSLYLTFKYWLVIVLAAFSSFSPGISSLQGDKPAETCKPGMCHWPSQNSLEETPRGTITLWKCWEGRVCCLI